MREIENLTRTARTYVIDLAERTLASAAGGFGAALIPTQAADISMWYTALGAGVAAGLAVIKGAAARLRGSSFSASFSKQV